MNASLVFASGIFKAEFISLSAEGQKFMIRKSDKILFDKLLIDLLGNYQVRNICTALQALEILRKSFPKIENAAVSSLNKCSMGYTERLV